MINLDFEQSLLESHKCLSDATCKKIEDIVNNYVAEDGVISIRFITDREIQKLNRMYREKDEVTDVLSFQYPDSDQQIGDVAISYEQAKQQAHGSVEHEVIDLVVHGILHVLGHDHEKPGEDKDMFSLQDKIVEQII